MAKAKAKKAKYVAPTEQEKKIWEAVCAMQNQINCIEEDTVQLFEAVDQLDNAICPRVAARLTALEKQVAVKPAPQWEPLAIKYTLLLQTVDRLLASVHGAAGPYHAKVMLDAVDSLRTMRAKL